jgi:galactokinase
MNKRIENLLRIFQDNYSSEPVLVRSPGRANLIGDHTDYNDGFVLPAAIAQSIVMAIHPNRLNKVRAVALDMNQKHFEADISGTLQSSKLGWPNYLLGVVQVFKQMNLPITGFDCVFGGDIPIGAGLSSSAALEGAVIFGLNHTLDLKLSRLEMAKMGQQVEHQFVGVNCGIMDQFANLYGHQNSVIKLDCKSLEHELIPFPDQQFSILLCDTKVHRELAGSEYNLRRQQCEEAVSYFSKLDPNVKSLRDLTTDLLEENRNYIAPNVYNRSRFVLDENERVLRGAVDLEKGDLKSFGYKMYKSHYGLRDQYEVSCRELDILVETAEKLPGVLGARMMGGGFGGCTINLVLKESADDIATELARVYETKLRIKPEVYIVQTSDGTNVLSVEDFV